MNLYNTEQLLKNNQLYTQQRETREKLLQHQQTADFNVDFTSSRLTHYSNSSVLVSYSFASKSSSKPV